MEQALLEQLEAELRCAKNVLSAARKKPSPRRPSPMLPHPVPSSPRSNTAPKIRCARQRHINGACASRCFFLDILPLCFTCTLSLSLSIFLRFFFHHQQKCLGLACHCGRRKHPISQH